MQAPHAPRPFRPNKRWIVPAVLTASALAGAMAGFHPATALADTSAARTVTLNASADTYASTREPDLTHGSRSYVYATTDETFAYLAFGAASAIPSGYEVTSASLRVYVLENNIPSGSPVVQSASSAWSENTLNLYNQPNQPNQDVSSWTTAPANNWATIPLTASAVNTTGVTAYRVKYSTWYSNFRFASRESDEVPQLVLTLQAATTANDSAANSSPSAAADAGYSTSVMDAEFNDTSDIDLTGTGVTNKDWYLDRPFSTPLSTDHVRVSNGALTLTQGSETANVGLSSVSSRTGHGRAFQYGYFEIRMKYDEQDSYSSAGYPSFWMLPKANVTGAAPNQYPELDVFEAYHESYGSPYHWFVASVHDWYRTNPVKHYMNTGNNIYKLPASVDVSQYHTYGLLWTKGTLTWYFDNKPVLKQVYNASELPDPNYANLPKGAFSMLDQQTNGMALILGTGVNYPMTVDWVRVWH